MSMMQSCITRILVMSLEGVHNGEEICRNAPLYSDRFFAKNSDACPNCVLICHFQRTRRAWTTRRTWRGARVPRPGSASTVRRASSARTQVTR